MRRTGVVEVAFRKVPVQRDLARDRYNCQRTRREIEHQTKLGASQSKVYNHFTLHQTNEYRQKNSRPSELNWEGVMV